MARCAVSVLTPTYNRAHVLSRAYDSLTRQETTDFEWVVVDDGSTDGTSELLARWQAEADFPIVWFRYANNRGQIPATNEGRKIVNGEYTLKLDSDDALVDDAMKTIAEWRASTGVDSMEKVCGLAFRCVDENGNLVGTLRGGERHFPKETLIASTREARYRLGIDFDYLIVCKTNIYRTLSFGELNNSENLPTIIGSNRISDLYQLVYVDQPIRMYYRDDGIERLSNKKTKEVKWPRGNYLRALAMLNEDMDYFWESPKKFLNAARKITRLGLHIGRSPYLQFKDLSHPRARFLWMTGIGGGLFGYFRDRLRGIGAPKADRDLSAWGPATPPEKAKLHVTPERPSM